MNKRDMDNMPNNIHNNNVSPNLLLSPYLSSDVPTSKSSNLLSLSKESPILLIIHSAISPIQSSSTTPNVNLSPSLFQNNVSLDSPNINNQINQNNQLTLPSLSLNNSNSPLLNSNNNNNLNINNYQDNNLNNINKKNLLCKTPDCIVCIKGPPPSFEKGHAPIWAQILLVVLYALTESSKSVNSKSINNDLVKNNINNNNNINNLNNQNNKLDQYPNGKKYFHLRDDIYEFINIHWDVICRRERIQNWKHTIGMTLSHYHTLFKNGYNIFQNTGYWCLKDDAPNPYLCDLVMDTSRKRKYVTKNSQQQSPSNPQVNSPNSTSINILNSPNNNEEEYIQPKKKLNLTNTSPPSPKLIRSNDNIINNTNFINQAEQFETFNNMRKEIEMCKKEVLDLQSEVNNLQKELTYKKSNQNLLNSDSSQESSPPLSPNSSNESNSPPKPTLPFKTNTNSFHRNSPILGNSSNNSSFDEILPNPIKSKNSNN